ncbi:protein TBATA-like isoform X2 [Asterias amurensis]|uniref:protein TBATA-like isoform X2 n=1 Tax=Asterias amurensis TaxID=7602 RepID=UPI003AB4FFA3
MPVFTPSNGDPLVVRSTLGVVPEHNTKNHHLPMTRKDFAGNRPATMASARFGNLSQSAFFARHNPHPGRVRHIKGLNDMPICAVHDEHMVTNPQQLLKRPSTGESRQMYSHRIPAVNPHRYRIQNQNPTLNSHRYPINTLTGLSTYPLGFKEKADPKLGLIPITDLWREELRQLTEKAGMGLPKEIKEQQEVQPRRTSVYSAETGRLLPPPSRAMSRGFSRQKQRPRDLFQHIVPEMDQEALVMEMLCQILQTDSINAVQSWLCSAGEREKELVLDMIRGAVTNESDYWKRTQSQEYYAPLERPHSQPPPNMILQNGYGELDRPDPTQKDERRIGTPNGYSRYSYEQEDHPALRKKSGKPDIFKIDHPQRPVTRSKSRAGDVPPPKTPKMRYVSTATEPQSWKPEEATTTN